MSVLLRLFAGFGLVLMAASAAFADEKAPVRDIFYDGTVVLDPEARLNVEQVLVEAEATADQPRLRVPAGGNVYWLVETVSNPGDVPTWWVEVFAARSDYIDLYVVDGRAVEQHVEAGLIRQATDERTLKGMGSHVLPFTLPAGEARTLVLRVQSRSLINYTIKAGPDYALNNTRVYRHFFVYSLMGGMLFLILYNLFLGAALRELDYLLYAGHGTSYFLFFFNSYGFAATLLGWTAHPWITVFSGFAIEIFGLAFVWRFLRVREWSRTLSWLMTGCIALLTVGVIVTPFAGYLTMSEIWMISYALVPFLVLAAAAIGIVKGVHQSVYILFGWTPMVVMTLGAIVAMLGYLDRPPSGAAINASVVLEMLVLSLALADRVRRLRSDRERAIQEGREKSTFLAMLSHEVRTPLNGIMGTVELLGRTRLNSKQRGYVENLQNAGNALMSLLNDVLQLAKSEAGKSRLNLSRVDLVAVTRSMCDLMSARASEKGLDLELHTHGDIPRYIEADEARLRQVLLNLIGNAIKFSDAGGVVVSLTGHQIAAGNAKVDFEVRDTGIGITEKDLDNLFKPFMQLHVGAGQSAEGTGLGLSICQDLVQAMGGTLAVESHPSAGSRFMFTLEFARAEEDADAAGQSVQTALPQVSPGEVRVLVVDDVELNRDVLKELLLHFGYSVSVAKSGEEALRSANSEQFDAIVTDIFMPGIDGRELVRRLRRRRNRARIIGLTAAYDDKVRRDCLSVGFDLVLAKPASGETLHRSLLGVLDMPRSMTKADAEAIPVFAPQYLDGYFEALGPQQASRMMDGFKELIEKEMERIASAIEQHRDDRCAQSLHRLGGTLSTVGLLRLGRGLEAMALKVRSGGEVHLDLGKVRKDLDAALIELEAYFDRRKYG